MIDKKIYTGLGIVSILLLIVALVLLFGGRGNKKTDINLYYVNPTEFTLKRRIITVEGEGNLKIGLNSLFKGIDDPTVENLFPKDVKFNSSKEDKENDVLIIDISANVLKVNYGLEVNYLYLMSIVHTASDITGYESIQLIFDGKKVQFFNNGLFLGEPLKIDDSVVE